MFTSMNLYAKMAFAVMVAAMALSYLYTKKRQRDIRLACNKFAFAFMRVSNFVAPGVTACRLRCKHGTGDNVVPRPAAQQSEVLNEVFEKVRQPEIDGWYDEAQQALLALVRLCGSNRTLCRHYRDPIQRLFDILRAFLVGCDNFANIATQRDIDDFESFLCDQTSHRETLFKRLSWDGSETFARLNAEYNNVSATPEASLAQPLTEVPGQEAISAALDAQIPGERDAQGEADEDVETGEAPQKDALPPESPLREKWRGWGCC